MSLEVFGDEGDIGPDGYVTEELYQETKDIKNAVIRKLIDVICGTEEGTLGLLTKCWEAGIFTNRDEINRVIDEAKQELEDD